jgi:hypothetical protein
MPGTLSKSKIKAVHAARSGAILFKSSRHLGVMIVGPPLPGGLVEGVDIRKGGE